MLPTPPAFPSKPTQGTAGRLYEVYRRTRLVAYWIPDCKTFSPLGASEGFCVYAFMEGGRVGTWSWTKDPEKLVGIMEAFRKTQDGSYIPETPKAPDGEPAMLRPAFVGVLQKAMEDALPKEIRPHRESGLTVIDGDG